MGAGIAFVHQELNLFNNLDVAANVFIGREPKKYGFLKLVDNEKLHQIVQPYLDRLGATFSPDRFSCKTFIGPTAIGGNHQGSQSQS